MRIKMTAVIAFIALLFSTVCPTHAAAQTSTTNLKANANGTTEHIPPGTVINMQNWQRYREFMPDGMAALFEGKYAWKMPNDVSLEVGPTIIHPLPRNYLAATEKYA